MQIFILDLNLLINALFHCDPHVIKLIIECSQLLSGAHWVKGNLEIFEPPYKLSFKNHPWSLWVRETKANYLWACHYGLTLCKEYTFRFGKTHACEKYLIQLENNIPQLLQNDTQPQTPFAQAVPLECKDPDPVVAYRRYYIEKKRIFIEIYKEGDTGMVS